MDVQLSLSSSLDWEILRATCWLPWLLTAMWPFLIPCFILRPCLGDCASVWFYIPILEVLLIQQSSPPTHSHWSFVLQCHWWLFLWYPTPSWCLCEGKLSVYVLLHPDAQCFCSIVLILASYLFIIASILRMLSTQECLKAFCTCSSHQISVTLYFGSVLWIYSCPSSSYSIDKDKMVTIFYTVLFPCWILWSIVRGINMWKKLLKNSSS